MGASRLPSTTGCPPPSTVVSRPSIDDGGKTGPAGIGRIQSEVAGPRQHACVVDSCNDGASTIGGVGPDKHCIGARNRTIRADRQDRTDFS